jgi:hypothetical protein
MIDTTLPGTRSWGKYESYYWTKIKYGCLTTQSLRIDMEPQFKDPHWLGSESSRVPISIVLIRDISAVSGGAFKHAYILEGQDACRKAIGCH